MGELFRPTGNPKAPYQLSMSELRAIAEMVHSLQKAKPLGSDISYRDVGGTRHILPPFQPFWARITGGSNPYTWQEVYDDGAGTYADLTTGRSCTSTSAPDAAYEVMGNAGVPDGERVLLHLDDVRSGYVFRMGGHDLTVQEVDGSPSYSGISTLEFHQRDGFVVANPSAGTARITIQPATVTQYGIVTNLDQVWTGKKGIDTSIGANEDSFWYVFSNDRECSGGLYDYGFVSTSTNSIVAFNSNSPSVIVPAPMSVAWGTWDKTDFSYTHGWSVGIQPNEVDEHVFMVFAIRDNTGDGIPYAPNPGAFYGDKLWLEFQVNCQRVVLKEHRYSTNAANLPRYAVKRVNSIMDGVDGFFYDSMGSKIALYDSDGNELQVSGGIVTKTTGTACDSGEGSGSGGGSLPDTLYATVTGCECLSGSIPLERVSSTQWLSADISCAGSVARILVQDNGGGNYSCTISCVFTGASVSNTSFSLDSSSPFQATFGWDGAATANLDPCCLGAAGAITVVVTDE